jgi:type VI secretion system protein ImpF
LRELKLSVRRDLENLLNTRQRCVPPSPELTELRQALVNYGIPDFSGLNMGASKGREQFCQILQNVIRQYEPRFKRVKVELLPNPEGLDRTLRFRIEALLRVDPAPEPVVFDSALEPTTGNMLVREASR